MEDKSIDHNNSKKSVFWIIGAGRFGRLAAERLGARYSQASFLEVDKNIESLRLLEGLPVETVQADGVDFLASRLNSIDFPSYVVPAVPVHLAFEWVKKKLGPDHSVTSVPVPEKAVRALPHPILADTGKLYASYADFICPDNCPEPPKTCTVTGIERKGILYRDFQSLQVEGFVTVGIQSLQLAPGVGGFKPEVLWAALEKIRENGFKKNYLLSTACLCHGVLDAFCLRSNCHYK